MKPFNIKRIKLVKMNTYIKNFFGETEIRVRKFYCYFSFACKNEIMTI